MAIEANYRAFGGRLVLKFSGESVKDVFKTLGELAIVLDADVNCGKCHSDAIYPQVRKAQTYDFYELVCASCGAKLSFGQHKSGTLWPKRDEHPDTRGWHLYLGLAEHEDDHGAPPPRSAPARKRATPPSATGKRPPAPVWKPGDSTELKALFEVARKEGYDAAFKILDAQLTRSMGDDLAQQCWDESAKLADGEAALRYLHQCVVSNAA